MKSYYYLPVVGNMLALWSDFKPEENGSIDSQDNEERKNKLNKTRRRVVSPSETNNRNQGCAILPLALTVPYLT